MDQLRAAITQALQDPALKDALRQVPSLADQLPRTLETAIRSTCGGREFYIAGRASRAALAERDDELRRAFNGRNLSELAHARGITERRARQILERKPRTRAKK